MPEIGLHYDVSFEEYRSWDAVNNSVLKLLTDQSPAHAKQYMDEGRPDTPALMFGRAADCYLLEPGRFMEQYAIAPVCDKRTKEGKSKWAEFESKLKPDQDYIGAEEYARIIQIYNMVSGSTAMRLIKGGFSQVCCVWKDTKTGLLCKARFDYLQPDIPMITDLKTTRSANPERFAKDMFTYGYYQQAGFYCMGYRAVTGDAMDPPYAIFAIEKEPPFVSSAFELGMYTIEAGKLAARRALDKYAQCLETGKWPAYVDKITILEMPQWALQMAGIGTHNLTMI